MKRSLFFIATAFLSLQSLLIKAQETDYQDIVVGQQYTINSTVYETERLIQVALPNGYDESEKEYPVLYLLDGQKWFLEAVSLKNVLTSTGYVPEFIVVGIHTDDSPRYGFFAGSDKLLDYLEKDIIAFIDQRFRTSKDRILFGWQFGAAFGIHALANRPDLFNGWLAASPYPIQNGKITALKEAIEKDRLVDEKLLFATNLNENDVEDHATALEAMLEDHDYDKLDWRYQHLEYETLAAAGHLATPLGTLYQGLRFYFGDYPNLEFSSVEQFESLGGFDYVQQYYKTRSEKYGVPAEIPEEGQFYIVRLGLNSNHYPTFFRAMELFKETSFLERANLGWGSTYANFYLTHGNPDGAIWVFESLANKYPESPRPAEGLGRAYEAKGMNAEALGYYEQAVSKAEKNGDNNLSRYQESVDRLKKNRQ